MSDHSRKLWTVRVVKTWERTIEAETREEARRLGEEEIETAGIHEDDRIVSVQPHIRRRGQRR